MSTFAAPIPVTPFDNPNFRFADFYVSLMSREKTTLLTRAGRSAPDVPIRTPPFAAWPLGRDSYSSQNQTSIRCLGPLGPSQKIKCVFTASPETTQREALGEKLSLAQSATGGTWQPARCGILFFLSAAV